jgi:predicted transcriptional regulator
MQRIQTEKITPKASRIVAALREHGPQSIEQLSARTGMRKERVQDHLRIARWHKAAEPSRTTGGVGVLWCVPEHLERAREMDRARRKESAVRRAAKKKETWRRWHIKKQDEVPDDPIVRVIVPAPAHADLPRVPCSVFELAAFL